MSDSRLLLKRISELRQRLEGNRGAAVAVGDEAPRGALEDLKAQVEAGQAESSLLGQSLRQLASTAAASRSLAVQLTVRARRMLERSRDLVARCRAQGERIDALVEAGTAQADLLSGLYRETTAMLDAWLRMARNLPATALEQFRVCDGMEPTLVIMSQRLDVVESAITASEHEQGLMRELAAVLTALDDNPSMEAVTRIAERLLEEVNAGMPLRMLYTPPERLAEYIACHSLNVARVMARVIRMQPEMRERRMVPIIAALIHDAGMLNVPVEILTQKGPLTDAQRRAVEAHCRRGAELAEKLLPSGTWLKNAVLAHHERLDGTGYPSGLQDKVIDPLTRLLTVCDMYAAMCAPRPYRPAHDPRAALTDVLLLAEQGIVDKFHAECLLQLTFYPVGSVVELADGAVARVVACHPGVQSVQTPARPVIAVLTDADRNLLALPRVVDLAQVDGQSIVRALSEQERVELIGQRYPEWV
jgi:HD-GYP domain-containing protein (c-di-GMP phosphodiesterase class II)